ncbi:MAG: hypothetical protein K0U34_01275 [Alphaproteobacteria bacterium]|nr:hypothetical protein [Alphaproteobacteria bacterium]
MAQGGYRLEKVARPFLKSITGSWIAHLGIVVAVLLIVFATVPAIPALAETGQGDVKIELNKVEQTDKGCRFYWLVNNQSMDLKSLDLSFYWFQRDGVIGGDLRFAFAPAAPKSLKVKKYMLPDKTCSDFASLLVNEINACTASEGPVAECGKHISYASRTTVEFLK